MKALFAFAERTVSLGIAVAFAFSLSYFLGHSILDGPLAGSDSPLHVGYAVWINRYFPALPHWYPLQGAGISLLHGYSVLPHVLVVAVHRLTQLSVLQSFRLISFLSFPLSAVGIYLFCWSELRNRISGLIAMAMYLFAPVSWTWLYNWGFFPQQVAIMLVPLSLLCFNRLVKGELSQRRMGSRRVWAGGFIVLLGLAILSHMMVASAIVIGCLLIIVFRGLSSRAGDRREMIGRGLKPLGLAGIVVALALGAYLVPYRLYGQEANRSGYSTPSPTEVHKLPLLEFFGLHPIDPREILTRMQFPLVAITFAAMGIVFALALRKKGFPEAEEARVLGLSAVVGTIFVLSPLLGGLVLRISQLLYLFVNFRSVLMLVTFLMPVLAGYGASAVPLAAIGAFRHRDTSPANAVTRGGLAVLKGLASSIIPLTLVAVAIRPLSSLTSTDDVDFQIGPSGLRAEDLWNFGNGYEVNSITGQFAPGRWPPFVLSDEDGSIDASKLLASKFPDGPHLRVDISPYVGERAKDFVVYRDASQINTYTFQINLFKDMWSYEQSVFFSREAPANEYGTARTLMGLADWFGLEYVILDPEKDPTEHYSEAGWEPFINEGSTQVWRNPAPSSMATVSTKPAVLVIGKRETDAYMTIFRLANDGMLQFSEALLIEGKERIDDYELQELLQFDGLILYGYDYKKGATAWDTIASYVKSGGSVFVDTGWEFWVPEWEFEAAPEVLPVDSVSWTDYGTSADYELGPLEIVGTVDRSKFDPLVWEGMPWTLSGAESTDVRDWGQVVLSTGGRPLVVAGELGTGRVVWSGMNLIAHATYQGWNYEEMELLSNLLAWLLQGKETAEFQTEVLPRGHPDQVQVALSAFPGGTAWLYWREAYYPDWHAYIEDDQGARELPIYRAGPGFTAMPLETNSESARITLRWESSIVERASAGLSVLGVVMICALIVDGLFIGGNGLTWLKIAFLTRVPRPFLGEGSNKEWAERKRREIHAGALAAKPHVYEPSEAIPWFPTKGQSTDIGDIALGEDGKREEPSGEAGVAAIDSEAQRRLLESWLGNTGHSEDGWAQKLLAKRQTRD